VRFHEIHRIETRLRRQLASGDGSRQIIIEKAANLNPTRHGVLDPTYIDAFDAEDQIYPIWPDFSMSRQEYERIQTRIAQLVGGSLSNKTQLVPISYDELLELVEDLPYNANMPSSSWVPSVLRRILERQRDRCGGRAYLYTRTMNRETPECTTAALSGSVLKELRTKDGPVICAFRDNGKGIPGGANAFWYPTLVLDRNMPSVIVNTTADDD
jgi:hypothetical protein